MAKNVDTQNRGTNVNNSRNSRLPSKYYEISGVSARLNP